jgi:hypothetical protein
VAEDLGEEHIIPETLGGGLILEKATCPCGSQRTHGFEGKVADQIYRQLKKQMKIRGKRRKRRPEELMLKVHEKFADPFDSAPIRYVEIDDHPSMLTIPRIKPLAALGSGQFLQVLGSGLTI